MSAASSLLQAVKMNVSFGGIQAVKDVHLDVGFQDLLCVIGPNGAGKSTLLSLLSGTLRPSSGRLLFEGRDLTREPPHEFARRGVIRKFQGTNLFQWLSVRDNLIVAGQGVSADREGPAPDLDEMLSLIGLRHRSSDIAECLPHGERQWLEIGMALMCRPRLLLLDEPAAGMSVEGVRRMADLLRRLSRDMAVVVIEHDIDFVRQLRCRTMVLHQGEVIRQGSFVTIEKDEEVRHIYLGRGKGGRDARRA
ncbi:ATP-binding cassette domain-containing protein [Pelomonas sp. APW6]|uniref:ATP-binding cassette domain-containing protein n=1 Tax=Roseateles subflavus TaxID=3053353 RepID=A0ABT7LLE2_9BURK|nr:ATP-binding cassette domain-containing protein [Pelomonas sp. APW6]MDL5032336.1 ATP-binding cassette domain-containing protein [Pelomonas sp. APW6]